MDDAGPASEHASVTAARWALAGATAALVALTSGATALLVVTSTTGVGLPFEDPHPLPGAAADGSSSVADVLLLPGGSQAASGTRAGRADAGPDDPLLVLRSAGSRSTATRTGLAARGSSNGSSAPASEPVPPSTDSAPEDDEVARGVDERPGAEHPGAGRPHDERPATERPQRPTPAPRGATPPAEDPEDAEDAEDADSTKGKGKGKGKGAGKNKNKDQPQDEGPDDRDVSERRVTSTSSARPDSR